MGRKSASEWVWILKDAELCYRENDINRFIEMWNDGQPIAAIADQFHVKKTDIALLVMHCEIEGLIEPRPGGLLGTRDFKWRRSKTGQA